MGPKKAKVGDVASGKGKKRGGASLNNRDGVVFKDARQRDRYESLATKPFAQTRYPLFIGDALVTIGIYDNVRMLLNNVGLLDFLDPPRSTFKSLTLEFLSSLSLLGGECNNDIDPVRRLSFRLFNKDYEMSLTEFAEILDLRYVGSVHNSKNPELRPEGFNPQAFWTQITGEGHYEAKTAKASSIHNPVFRYIHRVMACTIFGRGEMSKVNNAELFMLWAMVNAHAVNTCHYLVNNLVSTAKGEKGSIVVGGLVTFLVEKLGMEDKLDSMEEVKRNEYIDLAMCESMQMIEQVTKGRRLRFHLLISRHRSIQLPNSDRTDTRNPENWLYPIAAGVNQQAEQVQEEEALAEHDDLNAPNNPNFNLEAWCGRVEGELQLMREDQLLRGQQMEHMSDMLQTLMQHFNIHQAPPPGQQ